MEFGERKWCCGDDGGRALMGVVEKKEKSLGVMKMGEIRGRKRA